jgi:hypothetical protein
MSAEHRRIDDNLLVDAAGAMRCAHCDAVAGRPGEPFLARAALIEGDPSLAGPQVHDAGAAFVDVRVVFRQRACGGCGAALLTEVVPADEPLLRTKEL